MMHIPIHLVWEAKVAGPIQYRWMYPIERYLRKLKGYVCNKAQPEGSIAKGYLADQCLTFCSRYLRGVETKFNRPERNYDGGQHSSNTLSILLTSGRSYGKMEVKELNLLLHNAAVLYVLQNCDKLLPFIQEHKNLIINLGFRNVEQMHREEFIGWFREKIVMAKRGRGKGHEEGSYRTRQVPQTVVAPQQLIDEDLPLTQTLDSESLKIEGLSDEKKKGRGKAKGVPDNHNLEVHIYQGRYISLISSKYIDSHTRGCSRNIYPVLSKHNRALVRYTEYPEDERETLFARFKEIKFAYECTEEELKAAMLKTCSILFKDWMFLLRKPIFKKYLTKEARKAHLPDIVPVKAKLEAKKAAAHDQGFEIDELNIYREVVGKASHGRVLGLGSGIKAKDVYGCCEGSCKRARVDKNEELELKIKNMGEELQQYKTMKDELEQLKATEEEVKQMCEFMRVMMSQSNIQMPPTMADVLLENGVEHNA
ncbi:hypothetical protein Ddye_019897 [Dipteronia dyeriana]|uniref:DUF4218 domain-containing protein n=1 Tax=Dipteronia dyeriana TaxID=168575 RepID=A0AAD9WW62_9ROSI|nr:hypothetical protein Ddye_019897 [Dipteronia dyeriana]